MSRIRGEKEGRNLKLVGKNKPNVTDEAGVYVAPSVDGRDREYVVVWERKAIYKKPSFL